MKTWKNGEKASIVKNIIDSNFQALEERTTRYTRLFSKADWVNNQIIIPYEAHLISEPTVGLFIKKFDRYSSVVGGTHVDSSYNVILISGTPFDGKVVIK